MVQNFAAVGWRSLEISQQEKRKRKLIPAKFKSALKTVVSGRTKKFFELLFMLLIYIVCI